jgi:hypothetical protein
MRFRKLRIAWSVGWGIACVLLLVFWVRSYQIADRLHGRLWGSEAFLLSAKEGHIATVAFSWNGSPSKWQWETISLPVGDELSFPVGPIDQYASHFGFGWINRPTYKYEHLRTLPLPQSRGLSVSRFLLQKLTNNGVILMKTSLTLNGAGPLVPIWFLALLTGAFTTLPWIQWKLRFGLRTLLIGMTLVAVVLGLVVYAASN